jgi:hypothetical protein
MRKLLQINYLILVFAVFIIVYKQAFMQRYDKFYHEEGKTILSGNSKVEKYQTNKHLFFYEAKGLHQREPIFQFENADKTIKIDLYEISYPDHSKDNIHHVVTYLMPIITASEEVFQNQELTYGIYFAGEDTGDIEFDIESKENEDSVFWFRIINFVRLNLYLADTGYGELVPTITASDNDLLDEKPIRIEIFTAEAKQEDGVKKVFINRLLTTPFTITENSFPVRNSLINLFHQKETNNEPLNLTAEDLKLLEEEQGIYFTAFHNASKYNGVLFMWFGIYFLIVIVTSYFVFFFNKGNRNLGKVKPPKALKESIQATEKEKLKQ